MRKLRWLALGWSPGRPAPQLKLLNPAAATAGSSSALSLSPGHRASQAWQQRPLVSSYSFGPAFPASFVHFLSYLLKVSRALDWAHFSSVVTLSLGELNLPQVGLTPRQLFLQSWSPGSLWSPGRLPLDVPCL